MSRISILISVLLLSPWSQALEREGVKFPEQIEWQGEKLQLHGRLGLRQVRVLGWPVKVYVGALYVKPARPAESELVTDQTLKVIEMRFLGSVDKKKLINAWTEGLEATCVAPCSVSGHLKEFDRLLSRVDKKDKLTLVFAPAHFQLLLNGTLKGEIKESATFAQDILNIFLSSKTTVPELRADLLGL